MTFWYWHTRFSACGLIFFSCVHGNVVIPLLREYRCKGPQPNKCCKMERGFDLPLYPEQKLVAEVVTSNHQNSKTSSEMSWTSKALSIPWQQYEEKGCLTFGREFLQKLQRVQILCGWNSVKFIFKKGVPRSWQDLEISVNSHISFHLYPRLFF